MAVADDAPMTTGLTDVVAIGSGRKQAHLLASARADPRAAREWTAAGTCCDAVDALATLTSWARLPRVSRTAAVAAAGSASAVGALAVATADLEEP